MISLLERLSLNQAMRLAYGHLITVTTNDGRVLQYRLLRYSGYSPQTHTHAFLVRDAAGAMSMLTDHQLGLGGDHAVARLGEPERLAADDVSVGA